MPHLNSLHWLVACLAIATRAFAGPVPAPAQPSVPTSSSWRWSVGGAYRQLGDVQWSTGSQSAAYLLPQLLRRTGRGPNAGSETGPANRIYSDGFVSDDGVNSSSGETWFWGYEDAAQVQGGSLVFHGQTYVAADVHESSGDWGENLDGFGPVLQLEWTQPVSAEFSWGLLTSLFYAPFEVSKELQTFAASNAGGLVNVTDLYDTGGSILPTAPYSGTQAGPGPVLPNQPTSREYEGMSGGSGRQYVNRVTQEFDLDLTTLSIGPTFAWKRGRWGLLGGTGVAMNIANWSADQRETLLETTGGRSVKVREWHHHESSTDILMGAYVQAAGTCALRGGWAVTAFLRYDWSQKLEGPVGPSEVQADLNGLTAGLMVGCVF